MKLLGAVLAGGESRRFGSDKAVALLDGRTLIEHAIAALAAQTDAVVVCGREGGIADRPEPRLGPLGGINAALHEARVRGFDAVLTCPCDLPILPPGLAERLANGGYVEGLPVIGLWPVRLAPMLDAHLAGGGDRSVRGWARAMAVAPVRLEGTLPNLNTPQALAAFTASR